MRQSVRPADAMSERRVVILLNDMTPVNPPLNPPAIRLTPPVKESSYSPIDRPQILLFWLMRLRWLAVIGQCGAVLVGVGIFKLDLPLFPISIIVVLTVLLNIMLLPYARRRGTDQPKWLVPVVLIVDVILLTAMLMLTGGADNPFAIFYVVHVAVTVFALGTRWTWIVVGIIIACYGALRLGTFEHWFVTLSQNALTTGNLVALPMAVVMTAYFVTEMRKSLRRREEDLARAQKRVELSERFTSLTALAAGAAHELGSPLSTIAIIAKELEIEAQKAAADPQIVEDAQLIRQEVDRCRGILSRMRMDVGDDLLHKPGLVDAQDLVARASADLPEAHIKLLRSTIEPGAEQVWLSSRAVQRALGVLLRNAFDASPVGSGVELTISRGPGQVRFSVRDHGHGMSKEVLKRAGEPFFTTKEMGRGMGMGLFLVKLVAEQHGGKLILASESTGPQRGTTATLEFAVPE
jgi:two-component system, sensor histidine kinase RegB